MLERVSTAAAATVSGGVERMIDPVQPLLLPAELMDVAEPAERRERRANGKQPKNVLNELSGDEWIFFTKSIVTTSYPSDYGHRLRKTHGANKPPQLMRSL